MKPSTLDPRPSTVVSSDSLFAFSYGRVSSRARADGVSRQEQSIEVQDNIFTDYVEQIGLPTWAFGENEEHCFADRHSGWNKKADIRQRPEGKKMWEAIVRTRTLFPTAQIHLLLTKLDRIGRGFLSNQMMFAELRAMKVKTHIINLGGRSFDCDTLMGQKIIADFSWVAEVEVNNTQARIKDTLELKRSKGELCGTVPFGWDAEPTGETSGKGVPQHRLVENTAELKWLEQMILWRYGSPRPSTLDPRPSGWGYHSIAKELNAQGVQTKQGKQWNAGSVRKILLSRTVRDWLAARQVKELAA